MIITIHQGSADFTITITHQIFMIHSMRMRFIMILITTLTWFVTFMLIRGDTGITGTTADGTIGTLSTLATGTAGIGIMAIILLALCGLLIISITLGIITITAVGMIPGMAMATAGVDVAVGMTEVATGGITTVTITDIMPATTPRALITEAAEAA